MNTINKRRHGGGHMGGGPRHNNNRPRRFNNNNSNRSQEGGGGDAASVARTRRSATQNREKYQNMAHDATRSGDRVLAEYYLQHADHYYRVLAALPPEEPRFQPRTPNANGEPNTTPQSETGSSEGQSSEQQTQGGNTTNDSHMTNAGLPPFITQPMTGTEE